MKLLKKNYFEDGEELRSVWFQHIDGTILMLEDHDENKAPLALVFDLFDIELENFNLPIVKKTDYTIYFHDTDRNVLGYSSYPKFMGNSSNF